MRRDPPDVAGVEHRFVDAGGLRTHFAEAGSGRPLVMLHGWPQNWWMWRELIGPLAETHRVICPDLRGFGWTAAPPGGYDPEVFARDVVALLDALGIDEPVDLAGHDWGGWTGWMLCLHAPERVRRFLALNILHPFGRAGLAGLRHGWRFWYQVVLAAPTVLPAARRAARRVEIPLAWVGGNEAAWSAREREVFVGQFTDPDRALAGSLLYRHAITSILPRAVRGAYRGMRVEHPTLMLFGADDRVQRPELLRGFEANAPNARLELVPGVGHFIVDVSPDLVLDRARALFAAEGP